MIEAGKITVKLELDSEQFERDMETLVHDLRVGSIVHYQSYGTPGGEYLPLPRAAIITEVTTPLDNEFPAASLCILNPTGMFFNQDVPFSAEPSPGCWSWPPRA